MEPIPELSEVEIYVPQASSATAEISAGNDIRVEQFRHSMREFLGMEYLGILLPGHLPIELVFMICRELANDQVEEAEARAALRALRQTNRLLSQIATPSAFKKLVTAWTLEGFKTQIALMQVPSLRGPFCHVEHLELSVWSMVPRDPDSHDIDTMNDGRTFWGPGLRYGQRGRLSFRGRSAAAAAVGQFQPILENFLEVLPVRVRKITIDLRYPDRVTSCVFLRCVDNALNSGKLNRERLESIDVRCSYGQVFVFPRVIWRGARKPLDIGLNDPGLKKLRISVEGSVKLNPYQKWYYSFKNFESLLNQPLPNVESFELCHRRALCLLDHNDYAGRRLLSRFLPNLRSLTITGIHFAGVMDIVGLTQGLRFLSDISLSLIKLVGKPDSDEERVWAPFFESLQRNDTITRVLFRRLYVSPLRLGSADGPCPLCNCPPRALVCTKDTDVFALGSLLRALIARRRRKQLREDLWMSWTSQNLETSAVSLPVVLKEAPRSEVSNPRDPSELLCELERCVTENGEEMMLCRKCRVGYLGIDG